MRALLLAAFLTTYWTWTTDSGVRSFTDNSEQIPARYSGAALELTWEALHAVTDERWTPVEEPEEANTSRE